MPSPKKLLAILPVHTSNPKGTQADSLFCSSGCTGQFHGLQMLILKVMSPNTRHWCTLYTSSCLLITDRQFGYLLAIDRVYSQTTSMTISNFNSIEIAKPSTASRSVLSSYTVDSEYIVEASFILLQDLRLHT